MEENTKNMLAGRPYRPDTKEISSFARFAHRLCRDYNQLSDDEPAKRQAIIDQLFPDHAQGVYIQGPLEADYGRFTHLGKNFYANFNLTILDTCPITIGDNVEIGPNCSLVTALHPLLASQRNIRLQKDGHVSDVEYGAPITIGNNCWLATDVTICPGVTIGDNCVIGAGTVVTRDMPANSLVIGVPGRAVRKITEKDRLIDFPY